MMNSGGDAADQLVREGIQITEAAVKLAAIGTKNLAALLLALAKSEQNPLKGRTTLNKIIGDGDGVKLFPLSKPQLKDFKKLSNKYGLPYTIIHHKDTGNFEVMTRNRDIESVNHIMEQIEYTAPEKIQPAKPESKQSVREKLTELKTIRSMGETRGLEELGAPNLAAMLIALTQGESTPAKARLLAMLSNEQPMKIFQIRQSDLPTLYKDVQLFDVPVTPIRNKNSKDGMCDVLVASSDAPKIDRILSSLAYPIPKQDPAKNALARDNAVRSETPLSVRGNGLKQQTNSIRDNVPVQKQNSQPKKATPKKIALKSQSR